MISDNAALAVFVVAELNIMNRDEGCCADCCAPCGVLRELLDDGRLPAIIANLPKDLRHLGEAWTPLDETAIRALWRCGSNPPCDPKETP